MRLAQIGKRQFAFELQWNDTFVDPKESVRDALGEDVAALFTTHKGSDGTEHLAFAQVPVDAPKGSIYSYAVALAKAGRDGIFVAEVDEDRLWYVVIQHGQVMAGTDRSGPEHLVVDSVETMRNHFRLSVFSSTDRVADAIQFDPIAAVAKVRIKPMKLMGGKESSLVGALVLVAVVGAIGFGVWHLFLKKTEIAVDPAQQAAEQRALYVASVQSALGVIPTEAGWASTAYRRAQQSFPPVIAGWLLDGVSCVPTACTGAYSLPAGSAGYTISPVQAHFGSGAVSMLPDHRSFNATVSLDQGESLAVDDAFVYGPAETAIPLIDAVGQLGMNFAQVTLDGDVRIERLNTDLTGPADAPLLVRESLATRHDNALDLVMLRTLTAYLSRAEFVPTSLSYSSGIGAVPAAWRMEWTRMHGGEAQ